MKSHPFFALNVAFGTSLLVTIPSYYFCYRRREHKEDTIEMMMKANAFQEGKDMPEPVPMKQHPFLEDGDDGENNKRLQKEFVARMKERKEWQKPDKIAQDADEVFREVKK